MRPLPTMSQYAPRFFGEDSHGLLRKPLPGENPEFQESRALEIVSETEAPPGEVTPGVR